MTAAQSKVVMGGTNYHPKLTINLLNTGKRPSHLVQSTPYGTIALPRLACAAIRRRCVGKQRVGVQCSRQRRQATLISSIDHP